jgi:hypothetical protein
VQRVVRQAQREHRREGGEDPRREGHCGRAEKR